MWLRARIQRVGRPIAHRALRECSRDVSAGQGAPSQPFEAAMVTNGEHRRDDGQDGHAGYCRSTANRLRVTTTPRSRTAPATAPMIANTGQELTGSVPSGNAVFGS